MKLIRRIDLALDSAVLYGVLGFIVTVVLVLAFECWGAVPCPPSDLTPAAALALGTIVGVLSALVGGVRSFIRLSRRSTDIPKADA